MRLRILFLLAVAFGTVALPCAAQSGTVAFYFAQPGTGREVANGVLPVGNVPFTGFLYDGGQRMAHAKGGRFVVFHLPAGEHQFSASYRSLDPGDPAIHMNVTDGGSYCVRISASYKSGSPVIPFGVTHSVIEQVPCGKALVEAGKYRPLELKRIEPVVNVNVVSSQTFPNFKQ